MKKNLVLLNMSYHSDWERGVVNRNYFIASELIASGQFEHILSVDFLPFSLKKMAKVLVEQQPFKSQKNTVFRRFGARVDRDNDSLHLFHMSAIHRLYLKKVLAKLGMDPKETLFWSYTPFEAPLMRDFPESIHVFDAVDNWMTHPVYARYKSMLQKQYAIIDTHAHTIFTVSPNIQTVFTKKIHCIPNGVDASHFAIPQKKQTDKKIIGYHGVIQSRFDIALYREIVRLRPEYQFEVIGQVWRECEAEMMQLADAYDNVHLKGSISYTDLPNAIADWDAACIPHRVDAFTESMNPMKMYEYLATGKPIVSTPIAGVEQFAQYIRIAKTAEEFVDALDKAINTDSTELYHARQQSVASHTWKNRVNEMYSILGISQ